MRDFRDAKAMAHTLRAALAARGLKITISQSLELIAEAFGVADWNTLAAAIRAEAAALATTPPRPHPGLRSPKARQGCGFRSELEATLHLALAHANQRKHRVCDARASPARPDDDGDASTVMKACDVDVGVLRTSLANYLETEFENLVADGGDDAKPTAAFQRVVQRAVIHVQGLGGDTVTGAQFLVALFAERESTAAWLLGEQGMTRLDAVNFIAHGIVKGSGDAAGA